MRQKLFFTGLIVMFALSAIGHFAGFDMTLQFIISAIAIVFVAGFLGKATESVAHYAGQRLGGFLNATFGNAAELIIAIFLVKEGLFDMVKASITGSIIGNLLLVLGLSLFAGGLKYKQQKFNNQLAEHNSTLMIMAVIGLFVPAVFVGAEHFSLAKDHFLSLAVACILIVSYLLWLVFSMITHKDVLSDTEMNADHGEEPAWSKGTSIILLIVATVMVAFTSEWLVHTLDTFTERFGLSQLFVGAFVIAIVGNAAEHSAAIMLAMKNKIGAAVEIAIGSSLQIALFVAPVLILVSTLFGDTMDIIFTPIELTAIGVSVFIAKSVSRDGNTNWYEGFLLLMVYIILGFAFYLV
ncbi:calcium/proton exchanger [Paenibacillus radicis (ex Gao et al. 2016)]|uniref:Ca(2+)/H(+) antiporter n=1 Tax=Paenibacillus radicis (ex Gao et al. 2016) TaxID=1737354 RepID=A0A917MBI1_9BACL|nr:calcium/proton exchanger [Paenibacillus radicis (ex Gao et al. 2016)]GGG89544.1 calcium/proton exchanger [Paenibacillus radicis (ex Gao et al. 2016)]